ncbi:MAG: CDP-alcohol phosphatidyltransferase family protein [Deltaproteobacteria bacterium]|nr:MAG: CDP-alcohol phosphatidyltransferase family protein [Deltaproteobacteria bacterium]
METAPSQNDMTIKNNPLLTRLAQWSIARGATPNMISCAGLVAACAAAACLAVGAGHAPPWETGPRGQPHSLWPAAAGLLMLVAGILDLLDGAVARNGNLQTRFGGVLDSTLDRFGDMAVLLGCSLYFARAGNLTYVLLSGLALVWIVQISYVKARAEAFVEDLGVGFWQRGERTVAFILGGLSGHVATVLWILALLPPFTVARRLIHAWRLLSGDPAAPAGSFVPPWRGPRGAPGYVAVCLLLAALIVLGPHVHGTLGASADPFGTFLAGTRTVAAAP